MVLDFQHLSATLGQAHSADVHMVYSEWDDGLGEQKIGLFLTLSVQTRQLKAADFGEQAFRLLKEHFLADLQGDPYVRFEHALQAVNHLLKELESKLGIKLIPNMDVMCGVIEQDQLFLAQSGNAYAYLIRNQLVSVICDNSGEEKNTLDLFQNIVSGNLEVNDILLVTSTPLVQYITPSDLGLLFTEHSLPEAKEELAHLIEKDLEEAVAFFGLEVLEASGSEGVSLPLETEEATAPSASLKKPSKALELAKRGGRSFQDYLDRKRREDPRRLMITIGVLGVLLLAGIFWLSYDGKNQQLIEQYESQLTVAQTKVSEAATTGSFDKPKAALLLDEAEVLAMEVFESEYLNGAASEVLADIETQRDLLDKVRVVNDSELTVVADFTSDLSGSETMEALGWSGDRLVAFSAQEAFELLLETTREPYVIDEEKRVIDATYFEDLDTVLLLSSTGEIFNYENGTTQFADTSDEVWKSGTALFGYTNKFYLLDTVNNQIWRYDLSGESFGSAQGYLLDTASVDLKDAVSLAIDGYIWVLHSNGTITKLLAGEPVTFEIEDAPLTSFGGSTVIYTELYIDQVYVLDPLNERVLVFQKSSDPASENLTYSLQYHFEGLNGDLKDLYVDKTQNLLYLLTEKTLYEFKL